MSVVICIAAIILAIKGLIMIALPILWGVLASLARKKYAKKVYGKVVAVDTLNDENGHPYRKPVIKFKIDDKEVTTSDYNTNSEEPSGITISNLLYDLGVIQVGDKVIVRYDPENMDNLFIQQYPLLKKPLLVRLFLGIFYVLASILGICYVFAY